MPNRILTATVALLSTLTIAAQKPTPSPNLAGLAHVALRVHDLDASIAFYEKLGFVKAFALSKDGIVYEAFIKINDRQFIELYPATVKDSQLGFLHVCFEGSDLQSVHDYYVGQGLKPTDVRTAGAGNLLFTMPGPETPSGPQNMEYTQYMPGSLHSKDFGQHLGPNRIATQLLSAAIAFNDPAAASAFYLNKVSFIPGPKQLYSLPGTPSESIRIESPKLALKARITFAAASPKITADLKQRGLSFTHSSPYGRDDITLHDPDNNDIILISTHP
jgi:catechol 2,3-dioxygenase-like lactoylglutathione lyase family enzyme